MAPNAWLTHRLACQECGVQIAPGRGILCANFGCVRGPYQICQRAWHGSCYRQHALDRFPVLKRDDLGQAFAEDDEEPEDPSRFKEARPGDHLITPFQCDVCHFVNIQKREPHKDNYPDDELLMNIRRAVLDSFWARERGTVVANERSRKKLISVLAEVGIDNPYGDLARTVGRQAFFIMGDNGS